MIEAQAAGVPVVSTRVGGTASVVGDGDALAVADDHDHLVSIAHAALRNHSSARKRAASAQDRVASRFGLNRLISDLDQLYRRSLCLH
ncbi:MAG: glycosyltransferase [Solirubrobacteraceae bacterium]